MCIIMAVQASDNDVQVKPPIVVLVQTELPKHDKFCKLRLYTQHFIFFTTYKRTDRLKRLAM